MEQKPMTGSEYREHGRKMSKSDAPDTPMEVTDAIRISALQSEVNYWRQKYEWMEAQFTQNLDAIRMNVPN